MGFDIHHLRTKRPGLGQRGKEEAFPRRKFRRTRNPNRTRGMQRPSRLVVASAHGRDRMRNVPRSGESVLKTGLDDARLLVSERKRMIHGKVFEHESFMRVGTRNSSLRLPLNARFAAAERKINYAGRRQDGDVAKAMVIDKDGRAGRGHIFEDTPSKNAECATRPGREPRVFGGMERKDGLAGPESLIQ